MYLKSLTLRGFKTFADKTTVEFNPSGGIIAVVGPNGCGKSNIVDSIRWVLGEQSLREIRSSAMEDIIFAGTAARKPLSLGEVTLVIDNSDKFFSSEYTEVSIKRRVFRSGESEFFINKNQCRLKDIKDLFLDTGLGKGAYSIINQGRVDSILSSKPEERRAPFEEAAQISKYRYRKDAAGRKLIATEQNLLRINDLRQELTSQIKVLEVQAEKARKFKEIKAKLEELEIGLAKKQLKTLSERKSSQGSRIEKIKQDLESAENKFKDIELERQRIKEELKAKEADIEKAIADIEQNLSNIAHANKTLEIEQEREKSTQEQLDSTQKDITELKPQLEAFNKKLSEKNILREGLISRLTSKENGLQSIKAEAASLESQYEALQITIEELKARIFDSERAISEFKNQLIELDSNERFAKEELFRDEKAINKISEESDKLKFSIEEAGTAKTFEESRLEEIDRQFDEAAKKRKSFEYEIIDTEDKLSALKGDLSSKTSKLSLLKSILDEYQGFSEGVREVIKHAKNQPAKLDLLGVVADLIKVDEKVELAIETALGSNIQVLVTKTDATAKRLIEYLRKENLGKATFIPLNILKQGLILKEELFISQKGFVGIASNLIYCDSDLREAINFLLGRTIIFDTLDNALAFFKAGKLEKGARITTLSGELITSGGMITGGAPIRRTAAHLGREREIISLTSEIEELKKAVLELTGNVMQMKNSLKEADSEIEGLSKKRNEVVLTLARVKHEHDSKNDLLDKASEELSILKEGLNSRKKEIENIEKNKVSIKESVSSGEDEKRKSTDDLNIKISESNKISSAKAELSGRITEQRIEQSKISHELNSCEEEISLIKTSLARTEEQLNAKLELNLEGKLKDIKENIIKLKDAIPQLEINRENNEKALSDKRQEKIDMAAKIEESEKTSHEAGNIERVLRDKLSKEEVGSAKIEAEIDLLSSSITEEYGLSVEDILASEHEVSNQVKAKDEVRELKNDLRVLGDVNLLAIEEFERTKERLNFIATHVNDLAEARETLKSLIVHLDKKARESFIETVRVVSENFSKIFSSLFEGGEAKIMLIEGEDILDAGIEIIARPRGKKWLSLDLLSGGEKALTAIAILFALLRTHPSPFCFLDEVDAALDDTNIGRFAKMLKGFAEDTQMIVITHSKSTMEAADILYGITMEEPGISKLVSMKLSEVS